MAVNAPKNAIESMLYTLHTKICTQIQNGSIDLPPLRRELSLKEKTTAQARSPPLFKSQFSWQQQREVKRLRAEMMKFEQQLQRKSREAAQWQTELKQRQLKEYGVKLRAQSQRHREAVLIRKQQRWLQKREEQLLSPQRNARKTPSPSRILYRQLQQKQAIRQELQQRQRAELISVLSQQRKQLVNIGRLGEHQQSYLRRFKQQKAERSRRVEQARAAAKQLEQVEAKVNAGLRSRFYLRVMAENEQGRLVQEQMEKERQRSRERLKQFVERVRSESELAHKRRPLRSTAHNQQQHSATQLRPNLTHRQMRQLGNKFLKDSLMHISKKQKRTIYTEPHQQLPEKIDYLSEMRQQRSTQGSSRSFSLVHNGKIQRILGSPFPREEKVERLKRLAHRLQAGPSSGDAQEELIKIQAKMKILEAALRARDQ